MNPADNYTPALIDQKEFTAGTLTSVKQDGDRIIIETDNKVILCLEIFTDHVIRLRYLTDGYMVKDFSYAVTNEGNRGYNALTLVEKEKWIEIATPKLKCVISKVGLKVKFYNEHDALLSEDEKGFHWQTNHEHGGNIVMMSKHAHKKEHYFGLGDKTGTFNLRDRRYEIWGSDIYGYDNYSDPLYKNIPFFIGQHNKACYGIFFDNTFRSFFDFASERKAVTSFWAMGGEMNYYFIVGSDMLKVSERFTRLTGKAELPPLWALGYHQCKWSYYPESNVREICAKMRKLDLPCDAIYLDIDYMDGFRCFTWDKEKFPNPPKMIADLLKDGFKTIVIIDPGIKVDPEYAVFKDAHEKDYFCKRADGPYMMGKVWPGECHFPDFTNPEVRQWWADLFKELIAETGVHGVWNDMNEPAIFEVESKTFPDDVRHDFDGHPCSHRKAHNVYGMQMTRATYEGVKKYAYPRRPFLITRSAYAGIQRYSSVWTGDNKANWDHLRLANIQCLRLSISGISFCGSDIGGFIDQPSPQLYVRWIQMATFHPFMRTHSSGDHGDQEPWSFGENALKTVRQFLKLRYRLLPYLYSAFDQYVNKGRPILRPISFMDLMDEETYHREDEFFHGDHLLICPIMDSALGRFLYLPAGQWYEFWTNKRFEGKQEIYIESGIERIPVFVRAGALIPLYPEMNYVGEKKIDSLTLRVFYCHEQTKSELFEDRGDGYDYTRGYYNRKTFNVKGNDAILKIWQNITGQYEPEYSTYSMEIIDIPFTVNKVNVDGMSVPWKMNGEILEFHVATVFTDIEIE
jgi:alpha-glucosidase